MNREALIEQMSEVIVGAFRSGDFGFVDGKDAFVSDHVPIKLANLAEQHAKEVAMEAVWRVELDKIMGYYDTSYNIAMDDLEDVKQKVIEKL